MSVLFQIILHNVHATCIPIFLLQQQTPTASGYAGVVVESQSWLQQKQFQQQQMRQSPNLSSPQQTSAQAVVYQTQQPSLSTSSGYSASAGFHGDRGNAVPQPMYQQQHQNSSSGTVGISQCGQQHQQPGAITASGFGLQQQETVQRQHAGQPHTGLAQVSQGNRPHQAVQEVSHQEVKTEVESDPLAAWTSWSPASQPIVVQDFSGSQNGAEQTSTLTRGNQQDASESTLSRNYQQRQKSTGGMLTAEAAGERFV